MSKPTMILATSNGIGMGHLARACAITESLKEFADPIIVSMAGGIADISGFIGVRCEYIPGRDRGWMRRDSWDSYLKERLVALIDETGAKLLSFDGVVPYPGIIGAKMARPEIKLVWVRRGFWQKKPQRFVLALQSKMMDTIIEPGDFARSYDHGPTSERSGEAVGSAPISMFQDKTALSRDDARKRLGIDPARPAILVQLGTGEGDVNEKMTAALLGLVGWKDLQVVLTKKPVDANGKNLAPAGLDLKVIRYFPLARLLKAFDASICAAGYNGIHELLAAKIPTAFVPNIRGTDDQEMRARWCADYGYSLMADQADLEDIETTVRKLQSIELRQALAEKCAQLPAVSGGEEVAKIFLALANAPTPRRPAQVIHHSRLVLQLNINRGRKHVFYIVYRQVYGQLARIYRIFKPYQPPPFVSNVPSVFSDSRDPEELRDLIRGEARFEHLISGFSSEYEETRIAIAKKAYGLAVADGISKGSGQILDTHKSPLKIFELEVINTVLTDYQIESVIDWGIGDETLLPMPTVKNYLGVTKDRSTSTRLKKLFRKNPTMWFMAMDKWEDQSAELSFSFDIFGKIMDVAEYKLYMKKLFKSATKMVLIYSSNVENVPPIASESEGAEVLVHQQFINFARETLFKEFRLVAKIPNLVPLLAGEHESMAASDFYLYKRIAESK